MLVTRQFDPHWSDAVKITRVEAVRLTLPERAHPTPPRRAGWWATAEVANPLSGNPKLKPHRDLWLPKWEAAWARVVLEDGTVGWGKGGYGRPVAAVIDDHLAPHLVGEDVFHHERLHDLMVRLTMPYGATGLASYAVSAVDLAIWDARGKALGVPVHQLLGGKRREKIACYVTGNDVDWYQELGFHAFKLACPYGPADGLDGLKKNEEFVAAARERIGDDCELMLDCWMAFDVEYTIRLAERLRPYRLRWMEECLPPDELDAHVDLRRRLPWQTLTTGEHWYTSRPFQWAINHRVADILQPDINWVGGLTTAREIAASAAAAGIEVILHAGGNTAFGQHFSVAAPAVRWLETFVGTPPGVPLAEGWGLPGEAYPVDGWLTPSDAPGFGLELEDDWFTPFG
jgi:L-rhamnonate dehydratase